MDPSWLRLLGSILGGIVLLGGAVKAWPAVWGFVKATAKLPTMVERMHAEFSPNSGTSLRDKVDALNEGQRRMLQWQDQHADEDTVRLTALAEEAARVGRETAAVVLQTKEMDEYLHTRVHDILNKIAPLVGWSSVFDRRLDRIESRLQVSERGDERVAEHLIVAEREARHMSAETNEHIDRVHDEVRTGNALTMGALADDEETRRILLKPPAERTAAEQEHLRQIPPKENP